MSKKNSEMEDDLTLDLEPENDEINAIFGKDAYLREKTELSKKQIKKQSKKKKKKSSHSNDEMRNKLHQKIDNKKNTRGQSSVQTQLLENSKQLQDIVKQEASGKKISEEEKLNVMNKSKNSLLSLFRENKQLKNMIPGLDKLIGSLSNANSDKDELEIPEELKPFGEMFGLNSQKK